MRREEEGAGYRHARIQELIFEELRALLRDDVANPLLSDVRIAAVVLSVDYRHARVHFTLGSGERRSVEHALVRVTPFLRARLADGIDLKRVPDLRFVFDGVVPEEGGARCSE